MGFGDGNGGEVPIGGISNIVTSSRLVISDSPAVAVTRFWQYGLMDIGISFRFGGIENCGIRFSVIWCIL